MAAPLGDAVARYRPRAADTRSWLVALEAAGVFGVVLLLQLAYLTRPTFIDEMDNMIGGNVVSHGGAVYLDFFSQHTPLAYWISAVGYVLGFDGFTSQRLFAYAVFSLLLALLYARHVRVFGRMPLLLVAVLVPMMHFANPELSYTALSDNYQAIFGLFILFEVVAMGARRDSSLWRWTFLGAAAGLSFAVAFVSVYYYAAAVLCAALLNVLNERRRLSGVGAWTRFVIARASVTVAPFVILIAAVALTGALYDAYRQAYVLNRTYYPQYLADGFGTNPFEPFIGGLSAIATQTLGLRGLTESFSRDLVYQFAMLVFFLLATGLLCFVRPILGACVFWMGSLTATRGWTGFHSQPLWAFFIGTAGIATWVIIAWTTQRRRSRGSVTGAALLPAIAIATVFIVGAYPFARSVYEIRHELFTPVVFPSPDRTALIETLVPPGETYGEININNVYDFVLTRRLPAGGISGVTPWFGDMFDEEMTKRLSDDEPTLVFNDRENAVWGFRVADHIPLLQAYLSKNYTEIDVSSLGLGDGVFIRNGRVEWAIAALETRFPGSRITVVGAR